jgi:DDE superfamily endonuclease
MKDNGSVCLVTIDGTDCPINEPSPFSPKWYSHKTNGPGLRYEVGVCIQTAHIVWVNGPYPCGAWSDYRISRDCLIWELCQGEKFLADGGYRDGGLYAVTPSGVNNAEERMNQVARARHETVNSLLKRWGVLRTAFRHELVKHATAFHAIAIISQIQIEAGESRLFEVLYDDARWRLVV